MATKYAEIERVDVEIDEIARRILLELESASSKDLSDVHYAKMMFAFVRHPLCKESTATDRKCYTN